MSSCEEFQSNTRSKVNVFGGSPWATLGFLTWTWPISRSMSTTRWCCEITSRSLMGRHRTTTFTASEFPFPGAILGPPAGRGGRAAPPLRGLLLRRSSFPSATGWSGQLDRCR